jgi:DNA repair exonuclease SbcCD ATPase subunit
MPNLQQYRKFLEQQKGQKAQIEQSIHDYEINIIQNKRFLNQHRQAAAILREAGLKTQQLLSFHISEITTLALEAVFDNPYSLEVNFIERRNKSECDISFVRDGFIFKPMEDSGGGPIDIASFALRIASWSMQEPISDNVMILDEPFKHLKGEQANLRVLDMIHELSEKLGLQIIMVSDERVSREDIEDKADRVFVVKLKQKVSTVTITK